jgi:hypothetical protein
MAALKIKETTMRSLALAILFAASSREMHSPKC